MQWMILGGLVLAVFGASSSAKRAPSARRASDPRRIAALRAFEGACREIAAHLGMRVPRVVDLPGQANANASPDRVGVDAAWIASIIDRHCGDVRCSIQILRGVAAHELAHVLFQDHGLPACPESRFQELRADFVAGWVCGRLGYGSSDIQALVAELAHHGGCGTHPLPGSRRWAVWKGDECCDMPLGVAIASFERILWIEASRDCGSGHIAA